MQRKLIEAISSCKEPGLIILEAPMGCGKTEAALLAAEQLAYQTKRSGVFLGLPTQATSNGIFPRIKDWLQRVHEETHEKMELRLLHGKAYLNEEYVNLTRVKRSDADESGEDSAFAVNEWFSGKKTAIMDDFVVGTVDQFLLTALKQKHLALRHLAFAKKVVIIDEVHAYDAYMSQYLQMAIQWMAAYGVPVLLLSATLSESSRLELTKSYLRGLSVDHIYGWIERFSGEGICKKTGEDSSDREIDG
nr:DEAD/DEAH box helicase [Lachnoclostridium sp. Marseille-P6806]